MQLSIKWKLTFDTEQTLQVRVRGYYRLRQFFEIFPQKSRHSVYVF